MGQMLAEPNTSVIYRRADCVFCRSPDVTKEHLTAAWIHRAIQRRRRPMLSSVRQRLESGRVEWRYGPTQDVAVAACTACNNGFVARLDAAAARVLKPSITADAPVEVAADDLPAVAGWCWKTIMVNDLAITAGESRLAEYAPAFVAAGGEPQQSMELWLRPSSPVGGTHLIGVMPGHGLVQFGDGPDSTEQKVHQWKLMLGGFEVVLRPRLRWIRLPDPPGVTAPLWPASA